MKAKKKPVIVDVILYDGTNRHACKKFIGLQPYTQDREKSDESIYIQTLEGNMEARVGDYIIKGVKGEFYPCKPNIFKETYDIIEEIK